jgi:hypothetical protein
MPGQKLGHGVTYCVLNLKFVWAITLSFISYSILNDGTVHNDFKTSSDPWKIN